MKTTKRLFSLATLLSACTLVHANGMSTKATSENDNRINIGPDIMYQHQKSVTHGMLYGIRFGYDYVKPNDLYAGAEGMYSLGRVTTVEKSDEDVFIKTHSTESFANLEGRLGYNATSESYNSYTFKPFGGVGWYYLKPDTRKNVYSNWFYAAIGLKTNFEVNPLFNIGLNLKGMRSFHVRGHAKEDNRTLSPKGKNFWGYQIGVPLTWIVDQSRNLDVQLQPYFLKLATKTSYYIVGGQANVGYSF